MVTYNIEVTYLSNDIERTINVHYNSPILLNEEEKNKILEDFLSMVREYRDFKGIVRSSIYEDSEKKKN